MKILFSIFSIFLFSFSAVAAESAEGQDSNSSQKISSQKINFFSVFEIKHSSHVYLEKKDIKVLEFNVINRIMPTHHQIGGSVIIRINDTSSNILTGITFMPVGWARFDILTGVCFSPLSGESEKKFLAGLRLWLGNEILDFWLNGDGGITPFWGELILMIKLGGWFGVGGMVNTTGYGPRIEFSLPPPSFPTSSPVLKIWGGITGDWRRRNDNYYYWPEAIHAHVGVKVIF